MGRINISSYQATILEFISCMYYGGSIKLRKCMNFIIMINLVFDRFVQIWIIMHIYIKSQTFITVFTWSPISWLNSQLGICYLPFNPIQAGGRVIINPLVFYYSHFSCGRARDLKFYDFSRNVIRNLVELLN